MRIKVMVALYIALAIASVLLAINARVAGATPTCAMPELTGSVHADDLATVKRVLAATPADACRVDTVVFTPAAGFACLGQPGHWHGCHDIRTGRSIVAITVDADGRVLTPDLVDTLCHELMHAVLYAVLRYTGHGDLHTTATTLCIRRVS